MTFVLHIGCLFKQFFLNWPIHRLIRHLRARGSIMLRYGHPHLGQSFKLLPHMARSQQLLRRLIGDDIFLSVADSYV